MNYIRLQTNLIFEISTKNWADRYVFEIIATKSFCNEIFVRGPPSGIYEKVNFMKKLLGQWQTSSKNIKCFLIAKMPINKSKYNWLHEIHFFIYPWRGTTDKNFMEKRFWSNDFKYILIDSVFCADFKYEICLKTNVVHSVQNPSNISQKCQKSAIENKLLRVWLSGPPF